MTQSSTQAKDYNVFVIAGVFLLGAFICYLNSTFMNVALSDIMKDLNISVSTAQWLSTGYMLTTGIIIPFTAFLIDKFKNRTLFLYLLDYSLLEQLSVHLQLTLLCF